MAIAVVHVVVSREIYTNLLPASRLGAFTVKSRTEQWHRIIGSGTREGAAVFVAKDDGAAVVGFGCCSRQRSKELLTNGFSGEFQSIYILRSAQRCGLGRRLMSAMATDLARRSISGGSCWVLRENNPARRFYEALGGQPIAERAERADRPNDWTGIVEVGYGWLDLSTLARD
jgi:ribosomal protein S18 acetylase RimI-like enzyme